MVWVGHLAYSDIRQQGWKHCDQGDYVRGGEAIQEAVIDRFEDGWAVLPVGEKERKLVVPRRPLPQGVKEGHWLQVEIEGGPAGERDYR